MRFFTMGRSQNSALISWRISRAGLTWFPLDTSNVPAPNGRQAGPTQRLIVRDFSPAYGGSPAIIIFNSVSFSLHWLMEFVYVVHFFPSLRWREISPSWS